MNAKMMEGLVGAEMNKDLISTPFRVYKEARRIGDTAKMERAMGYVVEFSQRADDYMEVTEEGLKEDAETAREKEELEREQALQKHQEEQEEFEERIEESRSDNHGNDTVYISEEGRNLLNESGVNENGEMVNIDIEVKTETNMKPKSNVDKPVIYTKTGAVGQPAGVSISGLF